MNTAPTLENPPICIDAEIPLAGRTLDLGFPPPHAAMRACVVVPARDEEEALPRLLTALAGQRDLRGLPLVPHYYEVLLLLNNCTDRTAVVAQALQRNFPGFILHVAEIAFATEEAHVGRARQALFDTAFHRFEMLRRPSGLILTTDADSRPAPDWIAQNEREIAAGVEGVGGRITLDRVEAATLPAGVRRLFALDIGYRRALEELRSLYVPEPHDPFPRHHQHFGGSLAVTAEAYERAGGMPLRRTSEDVALYRAVLETGGRFRHSPRVRVETSARMIGRAHGGLADAIQWWNCQALGEAAVFVECARAADHRLAQLGLWFRENPAACPPLALATTPEPPPAGDGAEIHATLCALRERIATLQPHSLATRLQSAERRDSRRQAAVAQ